MARPIILALNSDERAILYNGLQDLIQLKEEQGDMESLEDLWGLFHRVEKLPHAGPNRDGADVRMRRPAMPDVSRDRVSVHEPLGLRHREMERLIPR